MMTAKALEHAGRVGELDAQSTSGALQLPRLRDPELRNAYARGFMTCAYFPRHELDAALACIARDGCST